MLGLKLGPVSEKGDVNRRNTIGCLDQYTAPNNKYIGGVCPTTNGGEPLPLQMLVPPPLKSFIELWWFDEQYSAPND